ncbi:hypothetical protein FHT02_003389 [Sphingomonas xinjiangensis]|uniref:Uncharacterized protein n=1 Tax=Sphingomonas xinjiangensis TaxID=643568 RepID=A0A840YRF8_9SPHN|nr:hypothetical protein [Sphingomonas xinjiangensis]
MLLFALPLRDSQRDIFPEELHPSRAETACAPLQRFDPGYLEGPVSLA